MLPVNFGFDPAMSLNAPLPAPKGGGVTPAATEPGSFHNMLRDAAAARAEAPAKTAPAHRENAMNATGRGAAGAARDQSPAETASASGEDVVNETDRRAAGAARDESPAETASAHGEDAMHETDREAAVDESRARPLRRSAANATEGQPVWMLLEQIIQNLIAAADTNAVAAEAPVNTAPEPGEDAVNATEGQPVWVLLAQIIQDLTAAADTNAAAVEGDAVASGPAAGDAAADLAALVDLLKQLQESPGVLTAESAIALDRLRQMLEQWQAGTNESQPAGLPGRLLDLLKNAQDALPGIALDRWAAALASQDGVAEKVSLETVFPAGAKASQEGAAKKVPLETTGPTGAGTISAAGSQHDGLPVGAGRAARGMLLDAKASQAAAGKADAAVPADERGPGAGRVMHAAPPATPPPAETLQSTAVSSKAQASDGSFALPRNLESAPDTQSEVSDDSRSPADKATAGLALSMADQVAEEGGSPSLRFDAALRDVPSFAVPEGSPDKPAEAAAAAKGRDTAAASVKADVFDQIVQRAAVHVKSGQGEMRIDLKPEFLGHVRLQIVTENQQVTVRILTELPMVRDMIESGIQQLKSDLQQQGLRVERVEVAVADDPRQHPGRQARNGAGRKGHADGNAVPAAAEIGAGLRPEASYRWSRGGQTTINMFA